MAHSSDPLFVVLHATRLKGFAQVPSLAVSSGLAEDVVSAHLESLAASGYVWHRDGAVSGWTLTSEGRAYYPSTLGADVAGFDTGRLLGVYEEFLLLNRELLATCTAWQVRDLDAEIANDHADPGYDATVVGRLAALHRSAEPVLDELSRIALRYAPYGPRLAGAVARVVAGDSDWFTKPLMDSYHTVWMELHEDLLVSLQIERNAVALRGSSNSSAS